MPKCAEIKPLRKAGELPLPTQLRLWENRLEEVSTVDLASGVRGRLVSDAHTHLTHIMKMITARQREEMEDLEFPQK